MRKTLLALCGLVIMPALILAQVQGKARIRGIVIDGETGQPLTGVTVKLYNDSVAAYYLPFPVTDKDGKWGAYYIRTGRWELEFEKAGYAPQKLSHVVSFTPGAREELLTVKLQRIRGLVVEQKIVEGVNRGNQLFAEKKYDEARAVFESILVENPDAYVLNKNIGNCYFAMENYDKAIEFYMKVYEKAPELPDILQAIASAYNNKGEKDKAAEWYQKIKVEDVQDLITAYNAGVSLYNSGHLAEAIVYFKKAIEIDREFADGYFQLGMASVAVNKVPEAIEAMKKFLELAPDSPQAPVAKSVLEALTKK